MSVLARLLAGLVLLVLAAVGAVVTSSGPASASCAEPSVDLLDSADVAFSGVVSKVRGSGDDQITTVRVDRAFKGDVTKRVDVVSPADQVDFTVTAADGDRLIVFGRLVDGEVTSDVCRSVTAPGKGYTDVLAALGEGTAPTAGYLKVERSTFGLTYRQFTIGRAVLGVLGLLALGYFVVRAWLAKRRTT